MAEGGDPKRAKSGESATARCGGARPTHTTVPHSHIFPAVSHNDRLRMLTREMQTDRENRWIQFMATAYPHNTATKNVLVGESIAIAENAYWLSLNEHAVDPQGVALK